MSFLVPVILDLPATITVDDQDVFNSVAKGTTGKLASITSGGVGFIAQGTDEYGFAINVLGVAVGGVQDRVLRRDDGYLHGFGYLPVPATFSPGYNSQGGTGERSESIHVSSAALDDGTTTTMATVFLDSYANKTTLQYMIPRNSPRSTVTTVCEQIYKFAFTKQESPVTRYGVVDSSPIAAGLETAGGTGAPLGVICTNGRTYPYGGDAGAGLGFYSVWESTLTMGSTWSTKQWESISISKPAGSTLCIMPSSQPGERVLRWFRPNYTFVEVGQLGKWVYRPQATANAYYFDPELAWIDDDDPVEVKYTLPGLGRDTTIAAIEGSSGLVAIRNGDLYTFFIDDARIGRMDTTLPIMGYGETLYNPLWSLWGDNVQTTQRQGCHLSFTNGTPIPWLVAHLYVDDVATAVPALVTQSEALIASGDVLFSDLVQQRISAW